MNKHEQEIASLKADVEAGRKMLAALRKQELQPYKERIKALEAEIYRQKRINDEESDERMRAQRAEQRAHLDAEDTEDERDQAVRRAAYSEVLLDKANPIIVRDLRACMDKHHRKDTDCTTTSCRNCEHSEKPLSIGREMID